MKRLILLIIAAIISCETLADDRKPLRWTFEDASVGSLPDGWTAAKTGRGDGSQWKVTEDQSAPAGGKVLSQVSEGPGPLFNLCVADEPSLLDLKSSLAFKANAGRIDQGGGPVWRYQDADNYYIARANPLENNFRVYKVVGGKRTQLATADVEIPAEKWHVIEITNQGDHIQCRLNGKLYLDVKDDTFQKAGKIGLWTKADAQTSFDDLAVTPLK